MNPGKITLPTEKGPIEVNSHYRWTQDIGGQAIDFALIDSPMHRTGHGQQLAIVVEKFGYSTGILLDHPAHKGRAMTAEVFNPGSKFKVKRAKVEGMARSRVSNLISRVSAEAFLDAYTLAALQAQVQRREVGHAADTE
jgi:hypothetical protein